MLRRGESTENNRENCKVEGKGKKHSPELLYALAYDIETYKEMPNEDMVSFVGVWHHNLVITRDVQVEGLGFGSMASPSHD